MDPSHQQPQDNAAPPQAAAPFNPSFPLLPFPRRVNPFQVNLPTAMLDDQALNANGGVLMAGQVPGMPIAGAQMMPTQQQVLLPQQALPQQTPNGGGISADDIALYDRQIRLWGVAAQAKIQSANILLITIKALGNEIAKNLVLAGIGSLTLLDGAPVTEADFGAQFFLKEGKTTVGENRARAAAEAIQELNPRVKVHADPDGVKSKGPSYFQGFDIVIATDLDPDSFNLINTATRVNGKAFYAAGIHGIFGFIFSDLIEHDYVIQRDMGNVATEPKQESRTRSIVKVTTKREGGKTVESVTKRELYSTWFFASDVASLPEEYLKSKRRLRSVTPTLSCLRALWEFTQVQGGRMPSNREDLKLFTQIATQKHKALGLPSETLKPEILRNFLQNLGSEVSPVAAIVGGQLAQDVINVLGQKQQPIQNMVVFDGMTMEAPMYPLHPEGSLGANLLNSTTQNGAGILIPDLMAVPSIPTGAVPMGMLPQENDVSLPAGFPREGVPMGSIPIQGMPIQPAPPQIPPFLQAQPPMMAQPAQADANNPANNQASG